MQSRLIFESDKTYQSKIQWLLSTVNTESEWYYLDHKILDENQIKNILNKNFADGILYLVIDRNESKEINKQSLISKIKSLYGKVDFKVWDKNFERIIEFRNEVYREGINASR